MDLSNPSLWVIRYVQSFTGDAVLGLDVPIPVFDTPDLSDRFLRVKVTSSTAKSNWVYGGSAKQIISAGGVEAVNKRIGLELNQVLLVDLPGFSVYKLRVKLPRYFTQATISIFGYTGV
jgi:hypothetical protein